MKEIFKILSRELLLQVILETHRHIGKIDATIEDDKTKQHLISIVYIFLSKHNMYRGEVSLFLDILADQDIESLLNVNAYNYHKLKLSR